MALTPEDQGAQDDKNTNLDEQSAKLDGSGGAGFALALGAFFNSSEGKSAIRQATGALPIRRVIFGSDKTSTIGFTTYSIAACTQRPASGRIWEFKSIYIDGGSFNQFPDPSFWTGGYVNGFQDTQFTTIGTAAAAGTLTITSAYLESFWVYPAAAWPAGTNQITVTNLQGGTLTIDIPGGTTNPVGYDFDEPIPAPFGNPVISVPAIVGGPAYTINAVGRNLGNGIINPMAELWSAAEVPSLPLAGTTWFNPQPNISSLLDGNLGPFPYRTFYPDATKWSRAGEVPFVTYRNVAGNNQPTWWVATVNDWAVEDWEETGV